MNRTFSVYVVSAVSGLIVAALPTIAGAVCEQERRELEKSQQDCKTLSEVSIGTSVIGSIFLPPLGGLIGAGPGAVAKHNCETVLPNKQKTYKSCLGDAEHAAKIALERQRAEARKWEQAKIFSSEAISFAENVFADYKEAIIRKFARAGYDIQNVQVVLVIQQHIEKAGVAVSRHDAEVEALRRRAIEANAATDPMAYRAINERLVGELTDLRNGVSL